MTRSVLVFGRTGQLGSELARAAPPPGMSMTLLGRDEADLRSPEQLTAAIERHQPAAVIIAAAYTAVDKAEADEATATAVNAVAPGVIAAAAQRLSAPVIFISTDYVFDGNKAGTYDETDPVRPLNAYGRSKVAGEVAVRAANPRHIILRTSWVYSAFGANFVRTMIRLAATRESVQVVSDQHGCPTSAADLAGLVLDLAAAEQRAVRWGTYHAAGSAETTWHGFADGIFETLAGHGLSRPANVPIASEAYPTPAARPRNSRLSGARLKQSFGVELPGWRQALPSVIAEILAAGPPCEGKQ